MISKGKTADTHTERGLGDLYIDQVREREKTGGLDGIVTERGGDDMGGQTPAGSTSWYEQWVGKHEKRGTQSQG